MWVLFCVLPPARLLDKLLVICPNSEHCAEVLSRCDLEQHLAYWCRGTVVPCANARAGCQFRAARALQLEHGRECRFQPRTTPGGGGGGGGGTSSGSPLVRPVATKSVVRFGPMPTGKRSLDGRRIGFADHLKCLVGVTVYL